MVYQKQKMPVNKRNPIKKSKREELRNQEGREYQDEGYSKPFFKNVTIKGSQSKNYYNQKHHTKINKQNYLQGNLQIKQQMRKIQDKMQKI